MKKLNLILMVGLLLQACDGNNNRIIQQKETIDSLRRELNNTKAELEKLTTTRQQPLNSFVISHIDSHFEKVFIQYYGKSEGMARLSVVRNIISSEQMKRDLYKVWQ